MLKCKNLKISEMIGIFFYFLEFVTHNDTPNSDCRNVLLVTSTRSLINVVKFMNFLGLISASVDNQQLYTHKKSIDAFRGSNILLYKVIRNLCFLL